ncbi:MAG TPA: PspC domain-containing protein [Sphingomicrobium sp.]|nr:PspC domain-containing protein [Sphingomicrobium sp.]
MSTAVSSTNIFLRNDTIFGTCQAIGDDFGFNPNWLRVPLATLVVVSPFGVVGAYLALSLVVLLSRTIFRAKEASATHAAEAIAPETIEANDDRRELIAA